ncbi:MAG TPA: penicillin-binding transpeptidase domain-containing protein, partial [Phnomibacter sp.]|nr:penicillin-binding transpeptidase domain-containing protein [Phnomibacter sp.]
LVDSICSPRVLQMVRACLEGVVERGTAKGLKTATYSFAGKTGTSLVADKGIKYSDHMYQSSFAGYFPADNPQYTVVVVIRNKPHAARYYGGLVAGPVFREIADKLYAGHLYREFANVKADSTNWQASGRRGSLATIARYMNLRLKDSAVSKELVTLVHSNKGQQVLQPIAWSGSKQMPALKGFGLKDAMLLCEQSGLQVSLAGKGKVVAQSIEPGAAIKPGQKVQLTLNYQ